MRRVSKWFVTFALTVTLLLVAGLLLPMPNAAEHYVSEGIKKVERIMQSAESSASTGGSTPQRTETGTQIPDAASKRSTGTDKWRLFWAYVRGLYLNNIVPLLLLSAPFVVFAFYPLVVVMNGWVLRVLAAYLSVPPIRVALMVLLSPHAWIELFSYSIATYESFHLSLITLRKKTTWRDIALYALFVALASALLFVAAVVESLTIILLRG